MRVLLSSFQCLPDHGSELGNGWHWARALADVGHDVTVLPQPSHIIRAAAPPDITFIHVYAPDSPARRYSSLAGIVHYYLRWQQAALAYMQTQQPEKYDVVHHVSWGSLHLGSMLWKLPSPLVYGPFGGGQTAPLGYWRYFGHSWPIELVRTAASTGPLLKLNARSRDTLRGAAVTLVTNSATAAAAKRLGSTDVRYMLDSGLPPSWIAGRRPLPAGVPVVLWVGRMMPRKAPLLALRAFAELRRSTPARLVMVGDGPLLEEMRTAVVQLGLVDDVELAGRVPWSQVKDVYDVGSVFLFTSLRDSFGSQVLEALGRGLPVVALDHQGIADLDVGPAAVKVPLPQRPRDLPAQLGSALGEVLEESSWPSRSAAARDWAARHVWPAKAAEATRIYEEVAGTRRA